jgi:hypothetical protein
VQVKTPRLVRGCSAAIPPAALPKTDAMTVPYRIDRGPSVHQEVLQASPTDLSEP